MEKKVTFTTEHKAKLDALLLKFLYNNIAVKADFSQQLYNISELLHNTADETLVNIRDKARKYTNSLNDIDEEDLTIKQEELLNLNKDIYEMAKLILKYRAYVDNKNELMKKLVKAEENLSKLRESTKTPEQKMQELETFINDLKSKV